MIKIFTETYFVQFIFQVYCYTSKGLCLDYLCALNWHKASRHITNTHLVYVIAVVTHWPRIFDVLGLILTRNLHRKAHSSLPEHHLCLFITP